MFEEDCFCILNGLKFFDIEGVFFVIVDDEELVFECKGIWWVC